MTDAKSELEIAAEECADEVSQRDHHGTDRDLILCGFNSGALWLLAELEKRYRGVCDKYELGLVREYEATVYRIIEEARELCGK